MAEVNSRGGKRKPMSEINVVPYIDVMLVLLVIFMVTAPMLSQGVKVELPEANAKPLDTKKDERVLPAAYNDAGGVPAQFNVNVLDNLNRLLDGNIDRRKFVHHALYNDKLGRIEMHLKCMSAHSARLAGCRLEFTEGELIHTENSYKYHPDEFVALAERAGFMPRQVWQDQRRWFSVMYFEPA